MANPILDKALQPQILKQMIDNRFRYTSISMRKLMFVRKLCLVCKSLNKLMKEIYPEYFDLIFFFKGKLKGSIVNSKFYCRSEIDTLPVTDKFWVIPRPANCYSWSVVYTSPNNIRFTHFCHESDYRRLKDEIFPKQFPDGKYPKLMDVLYGPKNLDDPRLQKMMGLLKRIRKGKIKKVNF